MREENSAFVTGFLKNRKERYMQEKANEMQGVREERSMQITHHEDLVSKFAMQFFGAELLGYLGIHLKIRRIEPTEIVRLEAKQMYEDFNFQAEDGIWYHVEFESDSILTDDLRRFREYEAVTSRTYKVPVVTCVLCSSNVKKPMTILKEGINTYRVRLLRLKGRRADAVFAGVGRKNRADVTKEDLAPIVFTPLMSGKLSQMERIMRGMKILNGEYPNVSREDQKRMQAALYILADKFLTPEEMKQVKEENSVNAFLQMYVDDGIRQGIREGVMDFLDDLGTITSDLSSKILNEKNEDTLKKWLKLAARAESLEQFRAEM